MASFSEVFSFLDQGNGTVNYYICLLFLLAFAFMECLFVTRWILVQCYRSRRSALERSREALVWIVVPILFLAFFLSPIEEKKKLTGKDHLKTSRVRITLPQSTASAKIKPVRFKKRKDGL